MIFFIRLIYYLKVKGASRLSVKILPVKRDGRMFNVI